MKFVAYSFICFILYFSTNSIIPLNTPSNNFSNQFDTINLFFNDSVKTKNFLLFGIVNHQTAEMLLFKKKYEVGFKYETCVFSPASYKSTSQNNQNMAIYLFNKYGDSWLNELPVLPIGIKK